MAYVYRHIRHDKNEPFYIGISKSDKYYYRAYATERRNKFWNNIVKKTSYSVEIILDNIDFETAKIKEKEFILLYGRKDKKTGSLVNLTDGGDGIVGRVVTEEQRKLLSLSKKGEKHPMFGKKARIETRMKISAWNKGKIIPKEQREKIRNKLKGNIPKNKGVKITGDEYLKQLERAKKLRKKVCQYGVDGELISIYDSFLLAANNNNLNQGNITNACKKNIMYGGYLWRFFSNTVLENIGKYNVRVKPIIKCDLNGNYLNEYSSVMEAARQNGFVKSTILRALKREKSIAYNFLWKYKN